MTKKNMLLLLCLLCMVKGTAQSYYVAATGSDGNSGDLNHPFATIQRGIDAAVAPGSVIYVEAGTYAAGFVFNSSGSNMLPITLKNYDQDSVYVDGGGIAFPSGQSMAGISNVSNITIEGLHFQNAINNQVKGILIGSGSSNITVRNCTFDDIHFSNNAADVPGSGVGASPFIVYGISAVTPISGITLTGNKIYNCRTGQNEAVTLSGNVDGFIIDSNFIYDIGNIGIDAAGHKGVCSDPALDQVRNGNISRNVLYNCLSPVTVNGQIYADGSKNITIENNTCYNGSIGIVAGCEVLTTSASNIIIRNNVVYHNSYCGIQVGTGNSNTEDRKVVNTVVSGNTCYNNDYNSIYAGQIVFKYCDSTHVMNNIMASPANAVLFTYYCSTGLGNVFDYNFYWSPSGTGSTFNYYQNQTAGYYSFSSYQGGTGQDSHSICADPQFLDAVGNDFHLQSISPAINAGNPTYAGAGETDMDGTARLVGIIDCGADESATGSSSVPNSSKEPVHLYPNPTSGAITIAGLNDGDAIRVTNTVGRLLLATMVKGKQPFSTNLAIYGPGIYFFIITRKDGRTIQMPVTKF